MYSEATAILLIEKEKCDDLLIAAESATSSIDYEIRIRGKKIGELTEQIKTLSEKHGGALAEEDVEAFAKLSDELQKLEELQQEARILLAVCKEEEKHFSNLQKEADERSSKYYALECEEWRRSQFSM